MTKIKHNWIIVDDPSFDQQVIESFGIPCEGIVIRKPQEGQYFAFPSENFDAILLSFTGQNANDVKIEELTTDVPGVGFVRFKQNKKLPKEPPQELPMVQKWEKARRAFVDGSKSKLNQLIADTNQRLQALEKECAEVTTQLISKLREQHEKATLLDAMINPATKDRFKTLEEEFDCLTRSNKFTSFDAKNGWLIIDTASIIHRENGDIGRFRIEIKLTGNPSEVIGNHYGVSTVKISRISIALGQRAHPHEQQSYADQNPAGSPFCLGNATDPIVKNLRECSFGFALDVVVRFLEEG